MKNSPRLFALAGLVAALSVGLPGGYLRAQDASGDGLGLLTYLEPYRSIEMSPAEGGIIAEILVKEGDRVLKDQVLLKLDHDVIAARLSVATAQADNMGDILAAESEYKLEKDRYDKLAGLAKRDVSSDYEVQRALGTMKASEGRLTAALELKRIYQLQVDQARAELDRRFLKSPIDGVVVEIVKDVAEPVNPVESTRDEFLVRVVQIDRLIAEVHVPGVYASRVTEGSELQLKVETAPGARPQVVVGKVEFVSPVIDSASNTVRIKVVVDNAAGTIRAGSPAQLILPGTPLAGPGEVDTAAQAAPATRNQ
ncbi:MAG: efflux RND transporter periplasmic adaptor subunit [Verrucomicrobiales bacterium]|nr:efflux RND transporter periplasmic adaptor subunit [Verrucomicrobiales bacterium]